MNSVKKLTLGLELAVYTVVFALLASGRFDAFLTLSSSYEIPLFVAIGGVTVVMILSSLMWYTFLDMPRVLVLSSLVYLLAYKYSGYGLFSASAGLTAGQVYTFCFIAILFFFSSRGIWYLWAGALALFWGGLLLDLTATYGSFSYEDIELAITVSVLSILPYISVFSRLSKIENDLTKIVPAKNKSKSGMSNIVTTETVSMALAVDDSDGGERTGILDFSSATQLASPVEEELQKVVGLMRATLRTSQSCLAFLYDESKNSMTLTNYADTSFAMNKRVEILAGNSVIGGVITSKKVRSSSQKALYSNDGDNVKYYAELEKIMSIRAEPIVSSDGELFGALVIDSRSAHGFHTKDEQGLKMLSGIAASLLLNIKLREKEEVNSKRTNLQYESSQELSKLKEPFNVTRVFWVDVDYTGQSLSVLSVRSGADDLKPGYSVALTASLLTDTMKNGTVTYEPSFQSTRQRKPLLVAGDTYAPYTQSVILLPVIYSDSAPTSCIVVESSHLDAFTPEDIHTIEVLVRNGVASIEKVRLQQQLERMATTDGLTGLCNHRTFQDKLEEYITQSTRYSRPLSLLLMDIDHFKVFNDTYGHQVGDQVLEQLSRTLEESVRTSDIPARYGGEEFVVVLPETSVEDAIGLAERIRQAVSMMVVQTATENLHVSVSIGVSTLFLGNAAEEQPSSAKTQEQLIGYSDAAMYMSKKDGRNRVTVFQPWMLEEQE